MQEGYTLNPLDILIAVVIAIGLYMGSKRGAIKGLTRMVTVIVAAIAGFRLRWIMEWLLQDSMRLGLAQQTASLLSFILSFVVVYVLVSTALGFLEKTMKSVKIGLNLDNALGALLGGTIATLVLSIAFVGLGFFNFPTADNAKGSLLYPQVKVFAKNVLGTGFGVLQDLNQQISKGGGSGPSGDPNSAPSGGEGGKPSAKPAPIR